jgi:hypothetical protein
MIRECSVSGVSRPSFSARQGPGSNLAVMPKRKAHILVLVTAATLVLAPAVNAYEAPVQAE